MKKTIFCAIALACMCLGACSKKENTAAVADAESTDQTTTPVTNAPILGEWRVTAITFADGTSIIPAQVDSLVPTSILFEPDSTFGVATNCNSLGGTYILRGDSITFSNMFGTRMACPDMSIEEALNAILPAVTTVTVGTDSTAALNAPENAIVQLRMVPQPAEQLAE